MSLFACVRVMIMFTYSGNLFSYILSRAGLHKHVDHVMSYLAIWIKSTATMVNWEAQVFIIALLLKGEPPNAVKWISPCCCMRSRFFVKLMTLHCLLKAKPLSNT